VNKACFMY